MKLVTSLLTVLFFVFNSATASAQEFQGQAIYFSKTTTDIPNFGGREMSEERRKEIMERMKSMFEKTYTLNFNRTESVYAEEEKLDAPGQGGGGWRMMGGAMSSGPQYKNVKSNQLLVEQELFGKQFLIADSLQKFSWKMGTETKKIGEYTCFKATAEVPVDSTNIMNFGRREPRRNNDTAEADSTNTRNAADQLEIPKTITVTAWYTPQIPVSQGPAEYWGLPGLILELNTDRTTILCTKIVLNPTNKIKIDAPKRGEKVTKEEYAEIVKEKTEEMREMFRGRGGNRG